MCVSEENCNNETKETEMLKKYEILYTAYADEIRNLWQRSIFLGAFMTLAWGGYGALLLKFITKENGNFDTNLYNYASLGLCAVIIVLSLLWIAMAKGSKFVQEAHEKHIERHTKKYGCSLFCDLRKYERMLNPKLCKDLLYCGILKPYRYSPSKINIVIGALSAVIAIILSVIHTIIASKKCCVIILAIIITLLLIVFGNYLMECLKGGETRTKGAKNG